MATEFEPLVEIVSHHAGDYAKALLDQAGIPSYVGVARPGAEVWTLWVAADRRAEALRLLNVEPSDDGSLPGFGTQTPGRREYWLAVVTLAVTVTGLVLWLTTEW